jgi:hypothetical protein
VFSKANLPSNHRFFSARAATDGKQEQAAATIDGDDYMSREGCSLTQVLMDYVLEGIAEHLLSRQRAGDHYVSSKSLIAQNKYVHPKSKSSKFILATVKCIFSLHPSPSFISLVGGCLFAACVCVLLVSSSDVIVFEIVRSSQLSVDEVGPHDVVGEAVLSCLRHWGEGVPSATIIDRDVHGSGIEADVELSGGVEEVDIRVCDIRLLHSSGCLLENLVTQWSGNRFGGNWGAHRGRSWVGNHSERALSAHRGVVLAGCDKTRSIAGLDQVVDGEGGVLDAVGEVVEGRSEEADEVRGLVQLSASIRELIEAS